MILRANNYKVFRFVVIMVVLVILFAVNRFKLVDKIKTNGTNKSEVTQCKEDEEAIVTQAGGKNICVKYPNDADKECVNSNQCESGYCVTKEAKVKSGTCFKSNYHPPCIFGYWTIEESQSKNDSDWSVPCVY